MTAHTPLPERTALLAVGRCVAVSLGMLARRRVHLGSRHLGEVIHFADHSAARVYRETTVDGPPPGDPCVLVVRFRLRGVSGPTHRVFEWESLLNTPLFVGFPGLVSKLWLAHDERGYYRGVYQWDGREAADRYARALWRVLALVSEPGSIDFRVLPSLLRDQAVTDASLMAAQRPHEREAWWRIVGAT